MKTRIVVLGLLCSCLLLVPLAQADIIYQYTGGQGQGLLINGMSFTYDAPDFVTPTVLSGLVPPIPVSSLTSYVFPTTENNGDATHPFLGIGFHTDGSDNYIAFYTGDGIHWSHYFVHFPAGSFEELGTFQQIGFGEGTLTVSSGGSSAVPEPASLLLLGTGLLGLIARSRFR